jgi:hypothetical protein
MGSGRKGACTDVRTVRTDDSEGGGMTMRDDERRADERETDERETYERPTLTPAGSFTTMTGLNGRGPKDTLFKHQLL